MSTRADRYRRLARLEADKAKADLLLKLANESDAGRLCTAEWHSTRPAPTEGLPRGEASTPWWKNSR
jgi:hypothetical protein